MSEKNPITVFASHAFEESDDYLRLFEFLEGVDSFDYLNVSKPENVPATGGLQAIKDELIEQIKAAEAVVVLSSTYELRPDIVRFIMDVTEANSKGMIALRPFGVSADTPQELQQRCQEHLEWHDR